MRFWKLSLIRPTRNLDILTSEDHTAAWLILNQLPYSPAHLVSSRLVYSSDQSTGGSRQLSRCEDEVVSGEVVGDVG